MGNRWRRAFCTTIPEDNNHTRPSSTPTTCVKLAGIFSSRPDNTPKSKLSKSAPSSPRSPFSLLRTALRLPKSGCGVCLQSVKTGQGTAIYTAECSHSFHFPCITHLLRKHGGAMVCPVCSSTWTQDYPLLLPVEKTIIQDDRLIKSSIPDVKTRPLDDPVKPFNDDEPLVSPTASGARFNPIPEAEDEDNEDGAAEFQGFFVDARANPKRAHRTVDVKLLPEAAVVSVGRSHETFAVAVRIKAPAMEDAGNRAPVDLVTVLDLTAAKLEMTKRAMRLVISSLRPTDRLSIVALPANRLLPLRRMTPQGQRLAGRIVDHLTAADGRSVGAAVRIGAKILEDRREMNPGASVILISDAPDQTNAANQRLKNSHVCSPRFGHVSVEAVADAFAKRVGVLLSLVVKDVRIQLGFSSGSAPMEIAAVYSCNGRPSLMKADSIRLGDFYAEEERELLVELRVPKTSSVSGAHHVMSVSCGYRDPMTRELMQSRERALLVPRPHAMRSSDPRIQRMRNLFLATRAVGEARRLVEHGEVGGARDLLAGARTVLAESRSGSAEDYVRWLDAEVDALQWKNKCSEVRKMKKQVVDPQRRRRMGEQHVAFVDENGDPLTPTSAWRAAEQLAKVAIMKKSLNMDLHGFENARF